MDLFSVLTMVGGLALFLFGMHALGEGLSKLSGGKLERILEKLTSTPIKAVLLGAGVTAVIQSSSATTVMVVGFVNSGIMQLRQAIGIIMGANIGTTATSWILSLSGIESSNIFVKLLKPSSFSPIIAIIGVAMILFAKSTKKQDIGKIFIGFSILMYGMETMSAALKPLAANPKFSSILTMFSNPILGMIAGALLTAIIQSSSASVGILQALCKTGAVQYSTALPVIMGQNIGTCITAILSSVGASRNAKRAALVHLYFNLIGTIVFMSAFYGLNTVMDFSFLGQSANVFGIAVIHSVFNIVATVLLLPFSKGLEKLAYLTIKQSEDERRDADEFSNLDERFLEQPGFAVNQCLDAATRMANTSKDALFLAMEQITDFKDKDVKKVVKLENRVDKYEDALGSYLMKLNNKSLSEKDSRTLSIIIHCMGDIERISDYAVDVVYALQKKHKKELEFSKKAQKELAIFTDAVKEIVSKSVEVFCDMDIDKARQIEPLEEVIDDLSASLSKRHLKRLRKGKCSIEMGFVLSDIATSYERVADHCSNIAVCLIQMEEGVFDTHEYLKELKHSDDKQFLGEIAGYQAKYRLP